MIGRYALLVPAVVALSVGALAQSRIEPDSGAVSLTPEAALPATSSAKPGMSPAWLGFDAAYPEPQVNQVRIEQRVIVRIAPRSPLPRTSLMAEFPPQPAAPPRLIERKMDDCVSVASISGVQTNGNDRLILHLRDRRMVSAHLERSCRARDFYSGFYVEKNDDGRLCVKRDKLQSRSGANCEVEQLRQLVIDED